MNTITIADSKPFVSSKAAYVIFSLLFLGSSFIALSILGPTLSLAAIAGSFLTCLVIAVGFYIQAAVKEGKTMEVSKISNKTGTIAALALVAVVVALSASPSFAQSTPVPLEIPTGVIFSETNNWLETFAPIAAIGIGITIALAVLGYLGKLIVNAFKR